MVRNQNFEDLKGHNGIVKWIKRFNQGL